MVFELARDPERLQALPAVEWYIIEQDICCSRDPFEEVWRSVCGTRKRWA